MNFDSAHFKQEVAREAASQFGWEMTPEEAGEKVRRSVTALKAGLKHLGLYAGTTDDEVVALVNWAYQPALIGMAIRVGLGLERGEPVPEYRPGELHRWFRAALGVDVNG